MSDKIRIKVESVLTTKHKRRVNFWIAKRTSCL